MPISFPFVNKVNTANTVAFYPTGVDYTIITASTAEEFAAAKELFKEYQAYLGEDLCFQSFDTELQQLDAMYGPPSGVLLLAKVGSGYVGCVALRDKGNGVCEMKRLYVKESQKGKGIGRKLAELIIENAQRLGYQKMVLDTLDRLKEALGLYHSLQFEVTNAYYHNPLPGTVYMQRSLSQYP